ncbi:larval cuticle protein 4-like [Lucilia cuprina]|uniref:larval cuticle protein 4-like n=1 Tax=Lucilia cuprina TaxID=7375 RepID=UPI001F06A5CF|nr:larval cuticle protein 4-like [Lucilia cuprina]
MNGSLENHISGNIVVICALLATAATAQRHGHGHGHGFGNSNRGVSKSSDDVHAEIVSADSDVRADGFDYHLETTNAISAKASGDAYGNVHGDFQWISPEGEHVAVSYVADENGYQPNSDVLPTPHPIPEAILKSLEYIRTHPPKEETHRGFGRRF